MGLAPLPYDSLDTLLANEPIADEDPKTSEFIKELEHIKKAGVLSRGEFLDICHWKSPRSIRHCEKNSTTTIKNITREVFTTRSERKRLDLLTSLHGVSVPTASSILTLTNPVRYGVIDIRVWQLLHALRSVEQNPGGQGFTFDHWHHFLQILRQHSKRMKAPARRIELTLFRFHQKHQEGTLYKRRPERFPL